MANTFDLVGSPLGLFTLKSRPTRDGMSGFNGGESRNINVIAYNTGKSQPTNLRREDGSTIDSPISLFTGGTLPNFWPNIKTIPDPTGSSGVYDGFNRNDLHNNDVYDTSVLNIIEKLSFSKMAALRPQDFAYLKNLGVYPNNRLMIARRFLSPIKDNIMGKGGTGPKSVLISWKPEGEDFLDISFGEEWEDADADFTNVLNRLGEDFGISGKGTGMGKAINLVPLPGFTENITRKVLTEFGVLSPTAGDNESIPLLPSGNPNIIKIAKRRKTIGPSTRGSGLKCTVNIKMVVEYEQKFISGIDPTVAWMDIINNILIFGTSKSTNYGLNPKFGEKIKEWSSNPGLMVDQFIDAVAKAVNEFATMAKKLIDGTIDGLRNNGDNVTNESNKLSNIISLENLGNRFGSGLRSFIDSIKAAIKKYRVELMGIANALSGAPSTPWHITVGNPLRPVFSSGDMYISDNVNLKLGPTLAFNDLPSNIKVEFTLTNARPWGLQEILAKFNTGHLRTVNLQKDYLETESKPGGIYTDPSFIGGDTTEDSSGQSGTSQTSNDNGDIPQTKENGEDDTFVQGGFLL